MSPLWIGLTVVAAVVAILIAVAGIGRLYVWANPEPAERVDAEEFGL